MPSIASQPEENVLQERPLTRRALYAVTAAAADQTTVASTNEPEATNSPTRRQVHRSTRATAKPFSPEELPQPITETTQATRSSLRSAKPTRTTQRALPQRQTTKVFNVEDYGPISPESQALTSSEAASPIALRPPTLSELMWLQEMRYHLRTPNEPALNADQLSKTYNDYCTAWISYPAESRWDKTFAVTSIGIAIGDILVETCLNCNWVVSDTDQGPVFGVRNESVRATYFPIDAVNRRWVAGKLDWIPGFIANALNTDSA